MNEDRKKWRWWRIDLTGLTVCVGLTGLVYAMFETSSFHDELCALEKLSAAGVFGRIVYSDG